jgi:lipoprotein NlpD
MRYCWWLICLFLAACESNPPAPVIDRLPQTKPATPAAKPATSPSGKDWRPDTYTVKKGDNLLRIGLEFGYDYKEIAAVNNIPPPYTIKVGQVLNFAPLKPKAATEPAAGDGVVVSTIKTEPAVSETTNTTSGSTPSAVTPVLSEPKATREPYSLEAMNRPVSKPTEAKPADIKAADGKTAEAKPADDEVIEWVWPTQGKVTGNFNESGNKGMDIAGNSGQAINAAANGKVIYTGSDLRGYGKLVIVKHNKTYLSVYAHNSKILVKEGQAVQGGQKIAEMGNTDSNTVKLHFEIRRQGKSVDPAKYLAQN